jgi:protein TonB
MGKRLTATILTIGLLVANTASAQTAREARRYYPRAALEQGLSGQAVIDCLVDERGRLDCTTTREAPLGAGFGDAAIRMSREFRIAPQTRDGQTTAGGRARLCFGFEPGPPPRINRDASACTDLIS